MHRGVRSNLEDILAGTVGASCHGHLNECTECSTEIAAMREQSRALRSLRNDVEPGAGFYARVMERIETQGVVSIWNLFFESFAGRAVAMASMILVLCLSAYMVSTESSIESPRSQAVLQGSGGLLTGSPDRDSVLVNLVTYREQ